jgi:outer membrane lipoprotein-sorting protein
MGSDMSYEDMSTRQLDEFNFNIMGNERFQDVSCYLLESKPKEHIRTEYSRHITWVDSTIFIPLKEESYDKTGKLLKEKYFIHKVIKKYHILTEVHVTNIQKNHSTTLKFENIELDRGVEDSFFHERYLKRLPK